MNPNEQKKVAGLIGAIVLVFGVGGFNIARMAMGGGTPPPAPTPAPTAPNLPVATGGQAPPALMASAPTDSSGGNGSNLALVSVRDPAPLPGTRTNPFRRILGPLPTASAPPPAPAPATVPSLRPTKSLVRLDVAPSPPREPTSVARVSAPPPAPVPSERERMAAIPMQLLGVVEGETGAYALIRVADRQCLVGKGELVGEFRVEAVEIDSVTLKHNDVRRVLRVGAEGTIGAGEPPTPKTRGHEEESTQEAREATSGELLSPVTSMSIFNLSAIRWSIGMAIKPNSQSTIRPFELSVGSKVDS